MAKLATGRKENGKWTMFVPGETPRVCKDADECFALINQHNERVEASLTSGGKERTPAKGVEYKLDGTKMTITIDVAADFGASASGKSRTVATTHGNVPVFTRPDGKRVFLSLNAYAK